jgi:dTMP kinase
MSFLGKQVVFEGPGGSGKSTVIARVAEILRSEGKDVVVTREPGGCARAEEIRRLLLDKEEMARRTVEEEVELFYEARCCNMMEVVRPALERGAVVLQDRDYMSTFVYQVARGVSRELVMKVHRQMFEDMGLWRPNLRLVFLVDAEEAMRRRREAGSGGDAFDEIEAGFLLAVARGYGEEMLEVVRGKGLFWRETRAIDANLPLEMVVVEAMREVRICLGEEQLREGELFCSVGGREGDFHRRVMANWK